MPGLCWMGVILSLTMGAGWRQGSHSLQCQILGPLHLRTSPRGLGPLLLHGVVKFSYTAKVPSACEETEIRGCSDTDGKPLQNREAIPLAEGQGAPAAIALAVLQSLLALTFQLYSQV